MTIANLITRPPSWEIESHIVFFVTVCLIELFLNSNALSFLNTVYIQLLPRVRKRIHLSYFPWFPLLSDVHEKPQIQGSARLDREPHPKSRARSNAPGWDQNATLQGHSGEPAARRTG